MWIGPKREFWGSYNENGLYLFYNYGFRIQNKNTNFELGIKFEHYISLEADVANGETFKHNIILTLPINQWQNDFFHSKE